MYFNDCHPADLEEHVPRYGFCSMSYAITANATMIAPDPRRLHIVTA